VAGAGVTRRVAFSLTALVLIGATAFAISRPTGATGRPLRGSLEFVPATIHDWRSGGAPPSDALPEDTRAPHRLVRTYQKGALPIWVSVGYYPLQDTTKRPPARELLFPRSGWTHLSEQSVALPVAADDRSSELNANLVLMTTGGRRLTILYWYQIGQRAVGSDHWYRAAVVYNRLVHGRADGALIRVASPVPDGMSVDAVLGQQTQFLRVFLPEILRRLPE
jgi:EpsI family protein